MTKILCWGFYKLGRDFILYIYFIYITKILWCKILGTSQRFDVQDFMNFWWGFMIFPFFHPCETNAIIPDHYDASEMNSIFLWNLAACS